MEDFTTYTEIDPSSNITITTTTCTFITLDDATNAWVYKDFGSNYFAGDFEHREEVQINAGATGGDINIWALMNTVIRFYGDNRGLGVTLHYNSGSPTLVLRERYAASSYSDTSITLSLNTSYYIKIKRDESISTYGTLYCYIYDDAGRTNLIDTLSLELHEKTDYRYIFCLQRLGTGTGTITGFSKNLLLETSQTLQLSDTITLSDDIELNLSLEKLQLSDTITLSDNFQYNLGQESVEVSDSVNIIDDIELQKTINKELSDTISLSDAIDVQVPELYNLINDFRAMKQSIVDTDNIVNTVVQVLSNCFNTILTALVNLTDFNNKINSKRQELYNIKNDIRTLLTFQIPGDAGVQSLGKSYIKVYIDSVEQTDIDVDSISITKSLNATHTATFELGRAYDATRPAMQAEVEIKYHIWILYKGYVTQISPADTPERIIIGCQDEYWKNNYDNKVYFNVGHKPQDDKEVYYNTIAEGLSACGVSLGVGNFIPQTIGLFGSSRADAISQLVGQTGNFAWYYKTDGTPALWRAGAGDIVNIEEQEIDKNIGLYQVLSHQLREDIENVVNQYRVQMGQKVIRRFNSYGGSKKYSSYEYRSVQEYPSAGWNSSYEVLARNSGSGFGFDYHKPEDNQLYQDVFRKYNLTWLDKELEEWSDRYDPEVHVYLPFGGTWKCSIPIATVSRFGFEESQPIRDGFTLDYKNQTIVFNQPLYLYQTNEYGEITAVRRPDMKLWLWKKRYYSDTDNPGQNPQTDIANPLMFFTSVLGADTIQENLNLTNLSIQVGGWYRDNEGVWQLVPSWDDTAFASDYAHWMLSQKCDTKVSGTVEITLDAFCYYSIELDKRIMINNILDSALNIQSITLNVSSFTASLQLQNGRYYARTVSLQSRGD